MSSIRRRKERSVERALSSLPEGLARRLEEMFAERGSSTHSRYMFARALAAWHELVGVDPLEATREDVGRFLREARRRYGEATVIAYLGRVKTFVSWLTGGELPETWRRVKTRRVSRAGLRDEVLRPEEVKALVRHAGGGSSPRPS